MPRKSRRRSRSKRGANPKKKHHAPALKLSPTQQLAVNKHIEDIKKSADACFIPTNDDDEYDSSKRDCGPLRNAIESINREGYGGNGMYEGFSSANVGAPPDHDRLLWFADTCIPEAYNVAPSTAKHKVKIKNKSTGKMEVKEVTKNPTVRNACNDIFKGGLKSFKYTDPNGGKHLMHDITHAIAAKGKEAYDKYGALKAAGKIAATHVRPGHAAEAANTEFWVSKYDKNMIRGGRKSRRRRRRKGGRKSRRKRRKRKRSRRRRRR